MNKKSLSIGLTLIFILSLPFIFFKKSSSNIEDNLPKGNFLSQSTSKDGKYTIKTYICNGGLTVDFAVRGELIENNTSKKPNNIYWDYHKNTSKILQK